MKEFGMSDKFFKIWFGVIAALVILIFAAVITFFIYMGIWVKDKGPEKQLEDIVHIIKKTE